ncbi:MAG TPA: DMT family transporter [Rhodocyclaceae bacterium]|jgi:drug/metabolite transporter (DMT)-like permease|nr:DMT family transporter [Rhodocyclaceae bacterium]
MRQVFHFSKDTSTGLLLAIGAAMGFGMKAIFVKLAFPYGVSPVTLLALRMVFSVPFFLWVGLRAGGERPGGRTLLAIVGCGLAGYYGASIFDFIGLKYISAGLERLILFTYPTLTVVAGTLLQKKSLPARVIKALALTYAGIGLAFMHDMHSFGDADKVWLGGGFVFASAVCYAGYLLGSGPLIAKLGSSRFTAWAMLVSTAATFAHYAATEPLDILLHQPWPVYGWAFAMAIFSTVLPVFMQSAAIRRMGAGKAAILGTVGPLLTIFLGWLILGEPGSIWQIIGAALVLGGVWQIGKSK